MVTTVSWVHLILNEPTEFVSPTKRLPTNCKRSRPRVVIDQQFTPENNQQKVSNLGTLHTDLFVLNGKITTQAQSDYNLSRTGNQRRFCVSLQTAAIL